MVLLMIIGERRKRLVESGLDAALAFGYNIGLLFYTFVCFASLNNKGV